MNKYIDAEKLKAEIERLREQYQPYLSDFENGCREGRNDVLDDIHCFITSLQQEQDILVLNKKDWEKQEQFRKDKKFGIPLQQEQPDVNFEKELDRIWFDEKFGDNFDNSAVDFANVRWICNYFYELSKNIKKKE